MRNQKRQKKENNFDFDEKTKQPSPNNNKMNNNESSSLLNDISKTEKISNMNNHQTSTNSENVVDDSKFCFVDVTKSNVVQVVDHIINNELSKAEFVAIDW